MRRITRLISDNLKLRIFLPLLGASLLTTWYGLFWSVEHFHTLTGGLAFMDMQPGLTKNELFLQIERYSQESISFYIGWSLFDYAWPFITFTTMCFISAWLAGALNDKWQERLWLLISLAYATVLLDWLENLGFLLLITGLPDKQTGLAQLTLTLHAAKLWSNFAFNGGFLILLCASVGISIKKRLKNS